LSRSPRGPALVLLVGYALSACGGGPSANPHTLLQQARTTLDAAPALHFALSSAHTPSGGTVLVGGAGDVVRPDRFRGTLRVSLGGATVSVGVISVAGTVYLKAPLTPTYVRADPRKYGVSDPGKLLDPQSGLSRLLSEATEVRSAGRDRYAGEGLDEVTISLPGSVVQQVLTSADPSQPVTGRLGISPSSHELRVAVLTGPFLARGVMTTFTVVLDHYGEHVTISAPH
jgi:lipoprotein LprG